MKLGFWGWGIGGILCFCWVVVGGELLFWWFLFFLWGLVLVCVPVCYLGDGVLGVECWVLGVVCLWWGWVVGGGVCGVEVSHWWISWVIWVMLVFGFWMLWVVVCRWSWRLFSLVLWVRWVVVMCSVWFWR